VSDDNRELVRIEDVTKRFGSVRAVDRVTTVIRENEFFALLGPSGCGKTTLLRLLAGFEEPDEGRILLDDRDLVGVRPYRRPLNMMFQSYAVFPHMTVEENVAYGLEAERRPRDEVSARVAEALAMVQLEAQARRRPAQLSGGQQQRVALARALVKRPRLLLLDEPLSALDRQIRGEMQIELKRLQHQVGITFLVVTHDQEEALTMADRIGLMRDGRIEQLGTPDELYERPRTRFVARFLGAASLFKGRVRGESVGPWRVPAGQLREAGLGEGAPAVIVVRPERLELGAPGELDALPNMVRGRVAEVAYLGTARRYVIDLDGGGTVEARVDVRAGRALHTAGDVVDVGWDTDDGVVVADDDSPTPTSEPEPVYA
jgi:spermidine/putrescine ABC transporter ATP-binding subunit